jgi:hypothetical protein
MAEQEEFDAADPARRLRRVRQEIRRQTARLPKVDANGRPVKPSPTTVAPTPEQAEPIRRVPRPNPAQGSSASGPPGRPTIDIDEARKRGDWKTELHLQNRKIGSGPVRRAPWDNVTEV